MSKVTLGGNPIAGAGRFPQGGGAAPPPRAARALAGGGGAELDGMRRDGSLEGILQRWLPAARGR